MGDVQLHSYPLLFISGNPIDASRVPGHDLAFPPPLAHHLPPPRHVPQICQPFTSHLYLYISRRAFSRAIQLQQAVRYERPVSTPHVLAPLVP